MSSEPMDPCREASPRHPVPHGGFEFYRDDDRNSGYGDNARVAYWYPRTEQERRDIVNGWTPPGLQWVRPDYTERPDPFDVACERRFDG